MTLTSCMSENHMIEYPRQGVLIIVSCCVVLWLFVSWSIFIAIGIRRGWSQITRIAKHSLGDKRTSKGR